MSEKSKSTTFSYYKELYLPEQTLYRNAKTLYAGGTGYIQPPPYSLVVGLGSGNLLK